MQGLIVDLRQSIRGFVREPGFTAVAVLALAIGVGSSTAMFSVVDAALVRPLPFAAPERLLDVVSVDGAGQRVPVGAAEFFALAKNAKTVEAIGTFYPHAGTFASATGPTQLRIANLSASMFTTLGISPARGRAFEAAEDLAGGEPVVIVSDAFWRRELGADPAALGRTLQVDHKPVVVVGVLPADAAFPRLDKYELFFPLAITPEQAAMSSARSGLYGVARLRPGITAVAAKAEMQSIVHATSGYGVTIEPLLRFVTGEAAPALQAAFAAVLLLLAIACTNVALVLLVRGAARARDLAVRAALGGGHGRVALQQMAEGVLLALAGGALGLLLAVWAVDGLAALAPAGIPRLREVRVDWRMAGFALLASLLSGALAGLVSAWRALRSDLFLLLKEGGAFATAGSGRSRARDGLVVAQLALALLLAAGAGLLLRSLQRLMAVPLGLDTQDVVATLVYPQQQTRADATAGLLAAARAIPGVESAALVGYLPLDPSRGWDDSFDVEGRSASDTNPDVASVNWFSPGYLETVGIRLLKGRDLSTADGAGSAPVAVVNETFARRYLSGREPIGARFASYDWPGISRVIVGVIQDVRQWGPAERSLPEVYLPQLQFAQHGRGDGEAMLVIKSRLPPGRLEAALRETAASLSSQLLLAGTRPLDADSSWVWRWASPRRPSDWRRWACMA